MLRDSAMDCWELKPVKNIRVQRHAATTAAMFYFQNQGKIEVLPVLPPMVPLILWCASAPNHWKEIKWSQLRLYLLVVVISLIVVSSFIVFSGITSTILGGLLKKLSTLLMKLLIFVLSSLMEFRSKSSYSGLCMKIAIVKERPTNNVIVTVVQFL